MNIGFIGLGNVGAKLAGNLHRTLARQGKEQVWVYDLEQSAAAPLLEQGAVWGENVARLASHCHTIITCLPSPAASRFVVCEQILPNLRPETLWMEMSTTDYHEIRDLAALVQQGGGVALECPVSGGCHRAATGNIAILVGGERSAFERALPCLTILGRRVLHVGTVGMASQLKVMTNYLATANLLTLAEALTTCKAAGLDMNVVYRAIEISSGNSFVHETESQVILNGSRDINFTMDLVLKDIGLFQQMAEDHGVPLEISPLMMDIFKDGIDRYGARESSPNIIRRLEEVCGVEVLGQGFPSQIVDDEPETPGYEVGAFGSKADT